MAAPCESATGVTHVAIAYKKRRLLIYLLFLLPPVVLAWTHPPVKPRITFVAVAYFVALLLFMGLRDRTGPDWYGYINIYNVVNSDLEVVWTEPLFAYLNVLSGTFGFYVYGVNFICTLIFLIGIFAYANCTARPWLAIAAVTPYLCFVIGMSGIRQAAAIGVCYIALANWSRLSTIVKLLFIAIAMGFHTSAIILVVLVILDDRKRLWLKLIFSGLFVAYVLRSGLAIDRLEEYRSEYVTRNLISFGAAEHVALSAFPAALYFIFNKRFANAGWNNSVVTLGAICSIAALPLTVISSTGIDRLALYFSYIQMWVYPALIEALKEDELVVLFGTTIFILSVFFIYFNLGLTISGYIPYHNLLVDQ
jgi:EpsG family